MTGRRDLSVRLPGAAQGGARLEVADRARHRRRAALPRPGSRASGRARRREQDDPPEPLRRGRRLLPDRPGLSRSRSWASSTSTSTCFRKNKQLSVFFAGALLFGNYTDPPFLGTRFDLGADVFGVAIPFTETNYRNGEEVVSEKIKHLPEFSR